MAHSFLKNMINNSNRTINFRIFCFISGTFLLFNSFVVEMIFKSVELTQMLAMLGALLLGFTLVFQAVCDIVKCKSDLNELAAISFLAAFVSSEYATAGFIAFFMLISLLIEYRSQLGARKNIEKLLALVPKKACRIEDGKECIVKCANLQFNDIVRVRPGDNIPADGIVTKGFSVVNEANITGESLPVEKSVGDQLYAGTINISGIMELKVTQTEKDSTLLKIKELILQAEKSENQTMKLINRYVSYYTPIILTIAAFVFFFTRDINRAISILIIGCPCTILLSIPSVKVAALSAAASVGLIIKDIATLETAAKLNCFAFDKTGTLTTGEFKVAKICPQDNISEDELVMLAANVEFSSKHPLALAVVQEAKNRQLQIAECENFTQIAGYGVKGDDILCGNLLFLKEHGIEVDIDSSHSNYSALYVAKQQKYMGAIYLTDTIRDGAKELLEELRGLGAKDLVMLTGDRRATAQTIAQQLDCKFFAEVLPEDKMNMVNELKANGNIVAVVGDGVNDAPALSAGDISIAMGAAGSDVAIHSASIVLLNNKLDRIGFFCRLARQSNRVMKQNLAFSILFIMVLLVLSAGGVITPILAVILHTVSALVVILNSSRLFRAGEELL